MAGRTALVTGGGSGIGRAVAIAGRGAIINVSSTFGAKPAPGISQYGASKAALESLTRSWALELADRGVRVNAIAPGPTESEGLHKSGLTPAQSRT